MTDLVDAGDGTTEDPDGLSPAERIVRDEEPGVVALAEIVALAGSVDLDLVRKARLRFFPDAGPEVEGDLWLSRLVNARSRDSVTFPTDVALVLLRRLGDKPARREEARHLLREDWHRWVDQSTVAVEEALRYALTFPEPEATNQSDRLLDDLRRYVLDGREPTINAWARGLVSRFAPALPGSATMAGLTSVLVEGGETGARPAAGAHAAIGVRVYEGSVSFVARPGPHDTKFELPLSSSGQPAGSVLLTDPDRVQPISLEPGETMLVPTGDPVVLRSPLAPVRIRPGDRRRVRSQPLRLRPNPVVFEGRVGSRAGAGWVDALGRNRIAYASPNGNVLIADLDQPDRAPIALENAMGDVTSLASWVDSSNRRWLVAGMSEGSVGFWDVDRPDEQHIRLGAHEAEVVGLVGWAGAGGRSYLATASAAGSVFVWNIRVGSPMLSESVSDQFTLVAGHEHRMTSIATWVDQGGHRRLVVGSSDGSTRVWLVDEPDRPTMVLTAHDHGVTSVAGWADPHGRNRLAAGSADGAVRVWDADEADGERIVLTGHADEVTGLTSWLGAGDRSRLASSSRDGTLRVWDADLLDEQPIVLTGGKGAALSVAGWVDGDGRSRLATSGAAGAMRVWDPDRADHRPVVLSGQALLVRSVTSWVSADGGPRLASGDTAGEVRVWDPDRSGEDPVLLEGESASVAAVAGWADADGGNRLASVDSAGIVLVWDVDRPDLDPVELPDRRSLIQVLAGWVDAEGRSRLATGDIEGNVRVSDPDRPLGGSVDLTGHAEWVLSMEGWVDAEGRSRLATGDIGGNVRVWDPDRPDREPIELTGHTDWVRAVVGWRDADGRDWLAAGGDDRTVRVWDLDRPDRESIVLTGNTNWVLAVARWLDADGRSWLATGGEDCTVRVWNLDRPDRDPIVLIGHRRPVTTIAGWVDAEGRSHVASASAGGTLRWEVTPEVVIGAVGRGLDYLGVAGALAALPDNRSRPSAVFAQGTAVLPALLLAIGARPHELVGALDDGVLASAVADATLVPATSLPRSAWVWRSLFPMMLGSSRRPGRRRIRRWVGRVLDDAGVEPTGGSGRSRAHLLADLPNVLPLGLKIVVWDLTDNRPLVIPDDLGRLGLNIGTMEVADVVMASIADPASGAPATIRGHRLCDPSRWLDSSGELVDRLFAGAAVEPRRAPSVIVSAMPVAARHDRELMPLNVAGPLARRLRRAVDVERTVEVPCRSLTGLHQRLDHGERMSLFADGQQAMRDFQLTEAGRNVFAALRDDRRS